MVRRRQESSSKLSNKLKKQKKNSKQIQTISNNNINKGGMGGWKEDKDTTMNDDSLKVLRLAPAIFPLSSIRSWNVQSIKKYLLD